MYAKLTLKKVKRLEKDIGEKYKLCTIKTDIFKTKVLEFIMTQSFLI